MNVLSVLSFIFQVEMFGTQATEIVIVIIHCKAALLLKVVHLCTSCILLLSAFCKCWLCISVNSSVGFYTGANEVMDGYTLVLIP